MINLIKPREEEGITKHVEKTTKVGSLSADMLTIYNYTSLTRELYLRQERKVGMWDTGAGGGVARRRQALSS